MSPGLLFSPDYQEDLRLLHRSRSWGDGGHKYAGQVMSLARQVGAASILDYGCGRGTLRPCLIPQVTVREYDPGIRGKKALPGPADLVVCSDVLEHIEPACLDAVIDHIYGLMLKAGFAVISTRPAHTRLPDRRNAHLIVQSVKWWLAQLRNRDWTVDLIDRSNDQLIVHLFK